VLSKDIDEVLDWIKTIGKAIVLNIAGSRESKKPGIYAKTFAIMTELLKKDS
jgi:hypothetical protein